MAAAPMTRVQAATVAHTSCPRCGAGRVAEQAFCLDCGLRLPVVTGPLARLRAGWIRRVGWYPGDWIWAAAAAAAIAVAGSAVAIAFDRSHAVSAPTTVVAPTLRPAAASTTPAANGRTTWPAGFDGWTVVLLSAPAAHGPRHPQTVAGGAARRGLSQVGILDSSAYGSLHPGSIVVFSGVFSTRAEAQAALEVVRQRGFGGAYLLRIAA